MAHLFTLLYILLYKLVNYTTNSLPPRLAEHFANRTRAHLT